MPINTMEEIKRLEKDLSDRSTQLHSLRLAVLRFVKEVNPYGRAGALGTDLALSAGIEFKNGTWILKEGE